MSSHFETDDGAYARFVLADTATGRDLHAQLMLGAVRDVSVGVVVPERPTGDATLAGVLDHVSIVTRGRFGRTDNPAAVLAVNQEDDMPDPITTDEPTVAKFDDTEIRAELVRLADAIEAGTPVTERRRTAESLGLFIQAAMAGDENAMLQFALAEDDTTTAGGVVPDFLSQEILSIVDTARPFVASFVNDPIGEAGMNVVYPEVTQKPAVGVQAAQHDEVDSQALLIDTSSFALATHAGANKVAIQLIERSQPSFVEALFREFAGEYAISTEVQGITDALVAITQVQLLVDASTDAAATILAFAEANTQVIDGVRRPSTHVWCGSARWEQLLSLVDTAGRPLVTWPGGGPTNAFGTADLSAMEGTLSGLRIVLVPNMGAADMIQGWAGGAANLEQTPQQLRALQVGTLAWELGVYGLYKFAVKYPLGFVKYTVA
jgi:hypothetical protein